MFKPEDIQQIKQRGIQPELVEKQLEWFKTGFPYLQITRPATISDGILRFEIDEIDKLGKYYDSQLGLITNIKFVPASGAATRMFKELYEFLEVLKNSKFDSEEELPAELKVFFDKIYDFAFFNLLGEALLKKTKNIEELIKNREYIEILDVLLNKDGLNYGNLPKGLLKFHKYSDELRTPLEEHLIECSQYCKNINNEIRLHLTVSPEHEEVFTQFFNSVKKKYEEFTKCKFQMQFSFQNPSTDTIAVYTDNKLFRNNDGSLLFRPGGHGALIENLDSIGTDLIFIKNIDNVVPDRIKDATVFYKRAIAGFLLKLREKVYNYLDIIEKGNGISQFAEIEKFVLDNLFIKPSKKYYSLNQVDKLNWLKTKLDRPIRICGMVKNSGEPGGGPFWAINPDGSESLQIAETNQIDKKDKIKLEMLRSSTHFNPVDLVCSVKNKNGGKYNLKNFIDPATGYISVKSKDGQDIKALELPGLWNGAMSDWNTIFVEVPLITFNPVKTVFDLLRPEHRG